MALREILTHHGASAGVYLPDLNSDGYLHMELKDIDDATIIKREREIDLNTQVSVDESEPKLKRPKFEDVASPVIDKMVSSGQISDFGFNLKVEDDASCLPEVHVNGQLDLSSVKMETESFNDGMVVYQSKEAVDMVEPKDLQKDLPENFERINLVKLARHSWLKNFEFLQDCAIRFLCVLSLDRYDFFFLMWCCCSLKLIFSFIN